MNFNEYQAFAKTTDVFTENAAQKVNDPCFITKILGLSGEAGEVAEKFKKILRDKDGIVSEEDKTEIVKELGDVLWYVAIISHYLGVDFNDVAQKNVEKLTSRQNRNVIHGQGDNR